MTNRTHDAVMLSFDPFSPPDYTFGYVASWRMINQSVWKMGEKETTGDTPTIVIDDLLPSTDYVAKISIYEDYTNRVLGESTEEIKFRTMPGCVYNSSSYAVGSFDVDCDSSCECLPSGVVECHDRCQGPYHKRGQFQVQIKIEKIRRKNLYFATTSRMIHYVLKDQWMTADAVFWCFVLMLLMRLILHVKMQCVDPTRSAKEKF